MEARVLHGPELLSPIEHKTLGHFFFDCCNKFPNNICQVDAFTDQSETYASVKLRSVRVAINLRKRGVTSNDVITICASNTLDNTIPLIGALFLGTTISNLDSSLSSRHVKRLLGIVTPKVIFVDEGGLKLIEESLEGASFKPEIVLFGRDFSSWVVPQEDEDTFQPVDVDPEHESVMFFSSGTTGLPKAICHSHRSFLYISNNSYQAGWRGVMFHFTTFYWITAMMILTNTFKGGSPRIFHQNPSPEEVFKLIEKYKVEFTFMAPVLTYKLTKCENAHKYNTSSLKSITCGGTPLAASQIEKMNVLFKSAPTTMLYGMSEVGVIAAFDVDVDTELARKKLTSSGKPSPDVQLKVLDSNTGELLGPNRKGEIHVFSRSLLKGYYRADCSHIFDEDGFMKTGDIGYYDEDGCVYVVERIKEMFKYQSWHIVPSSIEAVLLEHPGIKQAVVFGVPWGEEGEVPGAAVVLKDGCRLTASEIDKFLEGKVADREKLRGGITFMTALPQTPSGKVVRREVRDLVVKSV